MAGRTPNRLKLRKDAEQQPTAPIVAEEAREAAAPAKPTRRARKASPVKKPAPRRAAKAPPSRLRACWVVCDGSMKRMAVFDYNQRGAAEEKVVALQARNKGLYFLQLVKVPMENTSETAPE